MSDIRLIRSALRVSTPTNQHSMVSHKVAVRYLRASVESEYDMLIRLQYLEGVAGVPESHWSKLGGLRGIARAKDAFSEKFPDLMPQVSPAWWDTKSTHTFRILESQTRKSLLRFRIHDMDPLDIIDSALMGIPVQAGDPTLTGRLRPAYQLGLKHGDQIFKGQTPQNMAASGLAKAMYNRILDYAKSKGVTNRVHEEDEEGTPKDYADPGQGISAENFISGLMFGPHEGDPLARKVQEVMKASWTENSYIDRWFATIQLTGETPRQNEFADQLGILPQVLNRHLKINLERAVRAIWNNTPLRKALESRMIQEGIDGDIPEALMDIAKQPTNKVASTSRKLMSVLASYPSWILRQSGMRIFY